MKVCQTSIDLFIRIFSICLWKYSFGYIIDWKMNFLLKWDLESYLILQEKHSFFKSFKKWLLFQASDKRVRGHSQMTLSDRAYIKIYSQISIKFVWWISINDVTHIWRFLTQFSKGRKYHDQQLELQKNNGKNGKNYNHEWWEFHFW